jgi:cell division protein FtsI (penicillin-binding protein 3)
VSSRRIRALVLVAVAALGVLALRAGFLGVVRAGDLSAMAEDQRRDEFAIPALRGTIRSSDGRELAADRPAVNVSATPYLIEDPARVAAKLGPILDRDPNRLAELLSSDDGYALLARNVPPAQAAKARKLDIPNVDFAETYERYLPRGSDGSQVVGLTGDDRAGLSGLELQLDSVLRGRDGHRVEARDPIGRPLKVLDRRAPAPGGDVRLTVDSVIQARTDEILQDTVEEFEAKSAMAVVMRPSDGAVLAMSNAPAFDPAQRDELDPELAKNRVVTDVFEPGSTFKLVTVAGALEDGIVEPSTKFELPLVKRTYDRTLRDSHRDEELTASVSDIVRLSSNIGTVLIAEEMGYERLESWIARFGFLAPTGIDFPGEVAGLAPQWSGVSITNVPIGQGIGVTLMQMVGAYATIANGGWGVTPHLVERVAGQSTDPPRDRVVSAETAARVDAMLRGVIDVEGTGAQAAVAGYEVAGKTGTANKIDPETGEYSDTYLASFIGYLPADRPELLIAVVVDEPGGDLYYGGDVAAPAFEDIAEFSLHKLGIAP